MNRDKDTDAANKKEVSLVIYWLWLFSAGEELLTKLAPG